MLEISTLSLELVILSIAVIANTLLAYLVLRSNFRSATNIIFAFLSLFTILWLVSSYFFRLQELPSPTLWFGRLSIFFAAPMSLLFFLLTHTFPGAKLRLNRQWFVLMLVLTAVMMILNISPFAFTSAEIVDGSVSLSSGLGLIPFAVLSTFYSVLALYILFKKYKSFHNVEKKQVRLVLIGMSLMLALVTITILFPIIFTHSVFFVNFIPIYTLIFLSLTAYAIVKHHLFDLKVIATEALTVIVWILLFSKTLVSESLTGRIVDILILIATISFGILLIKSVRNEVLQRERLQILTKELQAVNERLKDLDQLRAEFLSFAAHQVKGPMNNVKGFASLIADGTYGAVSPEAQDKANKIAQNAERTISLVNNLLDLRKIEVGEFTKEFNFEEVNFTVFVRDIVEDYQITAQTKGLSIEFKSWSDTVMVRIDAEKIHQVIQNVIDNAIKYTEKGYVHVELRDEGESVLVEIADTGFGMSPDMIGKLFQRFSRDEKTKKEIRGTGLGLYLAKVITDAHQGSIWAESDGEGHGSRFYVRLKRHRE
jgi:signal transduction histidine kinase